MKAAPKRQPTAGVTLIEMMIALALFALIGSAGFAMLDQVLRNQNRTEGKLERLSEMQRAMHLLLTDFAMAEPHSLSTAPLSFNRSHTNGSLNLRYRLTDGTLHRELADTNGTLRADQRVLVGVDSIAWQYLTAEGRWSAIWPADAVQTLGPPSNPRAVELLITLADGKGQLRRVAPLPADPE